MRFVRDPPQARGEERLASFPHDVSIKPIESGGRWMARGGYQRVFTCWRATCNSGIATSLSRSPNRGFVDSTSLGTAGAIATGGLWHHHRARHRARRLPQSTAGHVRIDRVALRHRGRRGVRRWSIARLDSHGTVDAWSGPAEVAHSPVVTLPLLHAAHCTASIGNHQNQYYA
jgi:hypothetical protein